MRCLIRRDVPQQRDVANFLTTSPAGIALRSWRHLRQTTRLLLWSAPLTTIPKNAAAYGVNVFTTVCTALLVPFTVLCATFLAVTAVFFATCRAVRTGPA